MVSLFFPSLSNFIWDIFLRLRGFYQNHVLPLVMVVVALEILETSQSPKSPFILILMVGLWTWTGTSIRACQYVICFKVLRQQRERNNEDEEGCLENLQKSCAKTFRKSTLVPLFIIITLFLIQNWSGFIVTIMYTVTIFEEARIDLDEFQATILVGCVQVLGTTVGTVILNITGRRPLLMLSTGLCSLFMGMLGTIFFLKTHEPNSVIVTSAGSWLPLASLLGFTFSFTLGLGPIPWVLVGVFILNYSAGI